MNIYMSFYNKLCKVYYIEFWAAKSIKPNYMKEI